jgi:type VI secretion system protein ImpE
MTAEERLREGDLDGCLRELQSQVRKEPSKAVYRVFLFQLLAVTGAWDRALTQLNVAGELDAATLPLVQTYREALQCEALREAVFKGERAPLIFGEPTGWLALLVEALRLHAAGDTRAAGAARAQALDEAPATPGRLNGEPFAWLADADNRLGPTLETILNGRYYWIPFARIKRIQIEPPSDLRDRVWMPAIFTWTNDGQSAGLIPTRYPGTLAEKNPALWLAHRTEWIGDDATAAHPVGQRMFASDASDYALFDVRTIELMSADAHPEEDGAAVPNHG